MLSKSLVIFVGIGIISGLLFGIYLIDVKNTSQLVYVEGPGISILTEKFDFKKGEEIKITIMNTGTVPLSFSDASYGLIVKQLDSIPIFTPISAQVISKLESHDEVTFVWDQMKNNGEPILEGTYKITSKAITLDGSIIEKIVVIHVFK